MLCSVVFSDELNEGFDQGTPVSTADTGISGCCSSQGRHTSENVLQLYAMHVFPCSRMATAAHEVRDRNPRQGPQSGPRLQGNAAATCRKRQLQQSESRRSSEDEAALQDP